MEAVGTHDEEGERDFQKVGIPNLVEEEAAEAEDERCNATVHWSVDGSIRMRLDFQEAGAGRRLAEGLVEAMLRPSKMGVQLGMVCFQGQPENEEVVVCFDDGRATAEVRISGGGSFRCGIRRDGAQA